MKLTTDESGIVLEEVYSGIGLKTRDGEFMGICMRDTGFEFNYQGTWYEAKNGIVRKLNVSNEPCKKCETMQCCGCSAKD